MYIIAEKKTIPDKIDGNLQTHVAVTEEREHIQNKRIEDLEDRQTKLETRERELSNFVLRTVATATLAIFSSGISLAVMVAEFFRK